MKIYCNENPRGIRGFDKRTSNHSKFDLYQAFFPIYHISKIVGLLPVKFVKEKSGRYRGHLHIPTVIYSISLLLILIAIQIWGLWKGIYGDWTNGSLKSWMTMTIISGDILSTFIFASISILGAPFRWRYLQNIISKLAEVDEKLNAGSPKKIYKFTVILLSWIPLYYIVAFILDIYTWNTHSKLLRYNRTHNYYIPIYLLNEIIAIFEVQCSLITYNLSVRFANLNENLENILMTDYNFKKDFDEDFSRWETFVRPHVRINQMPQKAKVDSLIVGNGVKTCYTSKKIFQLMTIYVSLLDTSILINDTFGLPMLAMVLTNLVHLITSPYLLIVQFNSGLRGLFCVVECLWSIYYLIKMFIIVQPCYAASAESRRTVVLVSQLLSSNSDPEIRKQLKVFSLQLLHRPLEFSACGLFSVDRTVLTSVIGAVTTYLVIVIQFRHEDITKNINPEK